MSHSPETLSPHASSPKARSNHAAATTSPPNSSSNSSANSALSGTFGRPRISSALFQAQFWRCLLAPHDGANSPTARSARAWPQTQKAQLTSFTRTSWMQNRPVRSCTATAIKAVTLLASFTPNIERSRHPDSHSTLPSTRQAKTERRPRTAQGRFRSSQKGTRYRIAARAGPRGEGWRSAPRRISSKGDLRRAEQAVFESEIQPEAPHTGFRGVREGLVKSLLEIQRDKLLLFC